MGSCCRMPPGRGRLSRLQSLTQRVPHIEMTCTLHVGSSGVIRFSMPLHAPSAKGLHRCLQVSTHRLITLLRAIAGVVAVMANNSTSAMQTLATATDLLAEEAIN